MTKQPKPRIRKGPHIVYCIIGTDGSFCSSPEWWRRHANERVARMGPPCRVEAFRLVRVKNPRKLRRNGMDNPK